ncbi:hypothetical protein [Algoriphagus sp. CAU 1675]|uniref:hypothetical protein n=1 Tax=Algoriphagus sp. CAU 1675 TaxID=3032597 RepID=UPI0023D9BB0F|nr:hypothetical protein [Algoriphagus sp. CAU 1675]MDF2159374.1 hypothetical protein [Algoriphagus sp. CAU 1675]
MKKITLTICLMLSLSSLLLAQSLDKLDSIVDHKKDLAGKNYKYKATILSSNFTLPVVKFNRFESPDLNGAQGAVSFFNSVGAGLVFTGGEIREIRDANGEIINQDFTPTYGIHFGFLFSSSVGENSTNSFAPTIGFSLLDFQFGIGRELGDLPDNYKRTFYTVSYNIPLYKLKRGAYYVLRVGDIIDDTILKKGRLGVN